MNDPAPVAQKQRIDIFDSIRGVAVLGILLMNIPSMGYAVIGRDPFIFSEKGINYDIWFFNDWIVDGTQRALFSMLFGAGILLFMQNKSKQESAIPPADYFFRRQLWLIFFGLINIYIFLWHGDILFDYGVYGLIMFTFRLWNPQKLFAGAIVCLILMLARENRDLYLDKKLIARGEAIEKLDTTKAKLTVIQKDQLEDLQAFRSKTKHENRIQRVERGNVYMRNSYEHVYEFSVNWYLSNIISYSYFSIWDVLLFMFLGMAFFKRGILTGNGSFRLYAAMCIAGLGLGLLISWYDINARIEAQFNWLEYTRHKTFAYFEAGRTLRTLGIFGLLMLMFKSGIFKWLFTLLRPVGQMAFTNYLSQSILAFTLFYGPGLSLFGKLQRYEIYMIAVGIWTAQIIWSHLWLTYFRYGPFEWVWRQLTYWSRLPLRRS